MKRVKAIIAGMLSVILLVPSVAFGEEAEKASSHSYLSETDYDFVVEMSEPPPDTRNHWARDLFLWAEDSNIIHGYTDGSFKPDRYASEAELLKMIYKLFGAALLGSTDLDWSDGPYRLAKGDRLPIKGANDESAKFKPVTRQTAAEILIRSAGVRYTGEDAIVFLFGNGMIPARLAPTLEEFDGNAFLSRAEALEWLRVVSIKGIMSFMSFYEEPMESLPLTELRKISVNPISDTSHFTYAPITRADLNMYDANKDIILEMGMLKLELEKKYGLPEDYDFFKRSMYPQYIAGFDADQKLYSWTVEVKEAEDIPFIQTSKGIEPGKSTLFDVMEAYGTGGYYGNEILTYYYEEDGSGNLVNVTNRRLIKHNNNGFLISFIVNSETNKVRFILIDSYKFTFYDYYDLLELNMD
jgi:hypothetical protein